MRKDLLGLLQSMGQSITKKFHTRLELFGYCMASTDSLRLKYNRIEQPYCVLYVLGVAMFHQRGNFPLANFCGTNLKWFWLPSLPEIKVPEKFRKFSFIFNCKQFFEI